MKAIICWIAFKYDVTVPLNIFELFLHVLGRVAIKKKILKIGAISTSTLKTFGEQFRGMRIFGDGQTFFWGDT